MLSDGAQDPLQNVIVDDDMEQAQAIEIASEY